MFEEKDDLYYITHGNGKYDDYVNDFLAKYGKDDEYNMDDVLEYIGSLNLDFNTSYELWRVFRYF